MKFAEDVSLLLIIKHTSMGNGINKQQILLNKMKNFTTCLTRPTGESYKSPGGIMRYMMLLLMCLVTGVGMAQNSFTCTFGTAGDITKRGTYYYIDDNICIDINNSTDTYKETTCKFGSNKTSSITSTKYNIDKIVLNANKDEGESDSYKYADYELVPGETTTITGTNGTATNRTIICSESDNGLQFTVGGGGNIFAKSITVYYTPKSTDPYLTVTRADDVTTFTNKPFTLTIGTQSSSEITSYQWHTWVSDETKENGGSYEPITGATEKTYTGNIATAGTYWYYCVVENKDGKSVGSEYENITTVTVVEPYINMTITADQTVKTGKKFTLKVNTESNVGGLTYQWYRYKANENGEYDWDPGTALISGATSATYTETPKEENVGVWLYRCVVNSTEFEGISKDAYTKVTIESSTPTLTITSQPEGAALYKYNSGKDTRGDFALTVEATSNTTMTYQWYRKVDGAADETYVAVGENAATCKDYPTEYGKYVYKCTITAGTGTNAVTKTTTPVSVTYGEATVPRFTNAYANPARVRAGEQFVLRATTTSTPIATNYWWFTCDAAGNITSAPLTWVSSSLTRTETEPGTYYYVCKAGNGGEEQSVDDGMSEVVAVEVIADDGYHSLYIDSQDDISVKVGGALRFQASTPDNSTDRKYTWYRVPYGTETTFEGGELIQLFDGQSNPGKDVKTIVTRPGLGDENKEFSYYCTMVDKNNVKYISNAIHVTVTPNTDGLVIVTPMENVETEVYNEVEMLLEVNDDPDMRYTYQWYEAPTNSNKYGEDPQYIINGAIKNTYEFTPEETGTRYFYCVIKSYKIDDGPDAQPFGTLVSRAGKVVVTEAHPTVSVNNLTLQTGTTSASALRFDVIVGSTSVKKLTKSVQYVVEDNTIATIDNKGKVTALKAGTTTVTVKVLAVNGLFYESEGEGTITVTDELVIPVPVFSCYVGPHDESGAKAPEAEDEVYQGDVLMIRITPDDEELDETTWSNAVTNYEIYYTFDENAVIRKTKTENGKKVPNPADGVMKYTGSFRLTQTMTVRAAVWDIVNEAWSDLGEREFLFNFTLLKTITEGVKPVPGKGYSIIEDGKTYVTTTYGSLGDTGDDGGDLWNAGTKDNTMNGSQIAGFDYHCIGNADARGENLWIYEEHRYDSTQNKMYDGNIENPKENLSTFDIPIKGAYFKFEPEVDGQLNVIVRQNGIVGTTNNNMLSEVSKIRKRLAFVCDETGQPIENLTALVTTKSRTESKAFLFDFDILDRKHAENKINDADYAEYTKKLKDYMLEFYMANNEYTESPEELWANSRPQDYWKWCRNKYVSGKDDKDRGSDSYFTIKDADYERNCDIPNMLVKDGKGWYVLGKAYVRYSFPVKAGKTYFMLGRWTKLAPCGYSFKRNIKDNAKWQEEVAKRAVTVKAQSTDIDLNMTLEPEKPATPNYAYKENETDEDVVVSTSTEHYITLDRKFTAGVWTSLVLPFSMSPLAVEKAFGVGTQIIHFNMVDDDNRLHVTKHYHQMIVAGTPVLIKPTKTITKFRMIGTYEPDAPIWKMDGNKTNGWHVDGSYTPAKVPEGAYLMGYNPTTGVNNLRYINEKDMVVPGTRSWIVNTVDLEAKIVSISINGVEDNTTTTIENVLNGEEPSAVKMGGYANGIYSLSGQMVRANTTDTTGLPAGIYIAGGKKVVVK